MPLELYLVDHLVNIAECHENSAARIGPNPIYSYRKSRCLCLFWINCATDRSCCPSDNPIAASKSIQLRS